MVLKLVEVDNGKGARSLCLLDLFTTVVQTHQKVLQHPEHLILVRTGREWRSGGTGKREGGWREGWREGEREGWRDRREGGGGGRMEWKMEEVEGGGGGRMS